MRKASIYARLTKALPMTDLEIIDESSHHNVPKGSETHFRLRIISDVFDGESLINRHRRINTLLKEEFANGLHALALHTYTPTEWAKKEEATRQSPNCLGGKKKEQAEDESL